MPGGGRARSWVRLAFAVAVVLGLAFHALVWSGLATGTGPLLGLERLPRAPLERDPGWLPSAGWLLFWMALTASVVWTARAGREHEDRYESLALVAALLAVAGGAAAARGARILVPVFYSPLGGPTASPLLRGLEVPRSFDLAYALAGAGFVTSAIALVRIGLSRGRRRGALLAAAALLVAPGQLFWVHWFLVAPEYAQPRPWAGVLELAVVDGVRLGYGPRADVPTLVLYPSAGGTRIRPGPPQDRDRDWREYVRDVVATMPRAPSLIEPGVSYPDGAVLLKIDGRVPMREVLPVTRHLGGQGVWKQQFAVRLGVGHVEGVLTGYLAYGTSGPTPEEPALEVRVHEGPGRRRLSYRWRDAESDDPLTVLDQAAPRDRPLVLRVDPAATWAEVAGAAPALGLVFHGLDVLED